MSDHSKSISGLSCATNRRRSLFEWTHGLLGTVSMTAMAVSLTPAAQAACTTVGAATDCTGSTNTRTIVVGDGQTVTVQSGADVTGATTTSGTAFLEIVGEDNTLNNNGTITLTAGAGGRAVRMNATTGDVAFNNLGLIEALSNSGSGVFLTTTSGDIDIDNVGTIRVDGTGSGLPLNASTQDGDIAFDNAGTITSANSFNSITLSSANGAVSAINSGSIAGQGVGMAAIGNSVDVTNAQSGVLSGIAQVISVSTTGSARVENEGTISTTNGLGVRVITNGSDVSDAEIVNSGDITSAGTATYIRLDDGTAATVTNSGTLSTSARQGHGLLIISATTDADANLTATNATGGSIVTTGESATGIQVRNNRFLTAGGAVITAENAGSITTSGNLAHGIDSYSAGGDSSIINSGSIQVTGLNSQGIQARAYNGAMTVTNTGSIDADGTGINAYSEIGNTNIVNSGDVTSRNGLTAGSFYGNATIENSGTIDARATNRAFSAYGFATATNSGSITSAETISGGLYAVTGGASATALNTGDITMTGNSGSGVRTVSYGYSGTSSFTNARNEGAIITSGDGSVGVTSIGYSSTTTSSTNRATVTNSANGTIRTSGANAYGMQLQNYGAGDANIVSFGLIETTGDAATGIVADVANGDLNLTHDGIISATGGFSLGIDIETQTGDISMVSTGDISSSQNAIDARAVTAGDVSIISAGDLVSTNGLGIFASSFGDISLDNQGEITSGSSGLVANGFGNGDVSIINSGEVNSGFFGAGIVLTSGGSADIQNSGSLNTTGDFHSATIIRARSGVSNADLSITNAATGALSTTGDDSHGMFIDFIDNAGSGTIVLSNLGAIGTQGARSSGIFADVPTGDIDIDNSGTVQTGGAEATAILARLAGAGDVTVFNSGAITTSGFFASGIFGDAGSGNVTLTNGAAGDIQVTRNGMRADTSGNADLLNQGNISVTGQGAGLSANISGNLTQTNTGTIVTIGDGSRGFSSNVGGDALITNEGAVTVTGDGAGTRGLSSNMTADGDSTVVNAMAGAISVTGEDAVGITSFTRGGDSSVQNAGSLTVTGDGAIGIESFTGSGAISVENSGSITVTGAGARAMSVNTNGTDLSIVNSGDLSSTGQAIYAYGYGGALTLTSSGSITGDIELSETIDTVTISGALAGDVALGAFDDVLTFDGAMPAVFDQAFSGGAGSDTLNFSNPSSSTIAATVDGFETVNVSGSYILDGAVITGSEMFFVSSSGDVTIASSGASIEAATGVVSAGFLSFEPGAILDIDTGGFTAQAGSTTVFGIDASTPQIQADGAIVFDTGSAMEINVLDLDTLINGRAFDAAVSGTSLSDLSGDLTDNSMLFDFVKEVIGGDTLRITAEQILRIDEAVGLGDAGLLGPATALQEIVDGAGASSALLSTAFGQLSDDAAIVAGVNQFAPGDSGGFAELGFETSRKLINVIRHGAADQPGREQDWQVWGTGFAGDIDGDPDGISGGFDGSYQGFALGIDRRLTVDGGKVRLGAAYFDTSMDLSEEIAQNNDGDAEFDGFAFYTALALGAWSANAQIGSGDVDASGRRANGLIFEEVSFGTSGDQVFASASAERAFKFDEWNLGVGAAIDHVDFDLDGYSEVAGTSGLDVRGNGGTSTQSELFVSVDTELSVFEGAVLKPDLRIGVANRSNDIDPLSASFQAGGSSFVTGLGERSGSGGVLDAGLSLNLSNQIALRVGVEASSIGNLASQSGSIRLSGRF